MSKDLITIKTLGDPVVAEMYQDILAQEGITAMIPGAQHRGMLGLMGGYVEIPVKVPVEDAERAAEILAAIESETEEGGGEAGEDEAEDGEKDEEGELRSSSRDLSSRRKLKRVAFFIAFALPGGGHFYVGAWLRGLLFLLALLGGWIVLSAFSGAMGLALVWFPCLALADAIGAASRVDAVNGTGPIGTLGVWAARGLVVAAVLAVLGLYLATERSPEWFAGDHGVTICARIRTCAEPAPRDCLLRLSRGLRRGEIRREALEDCASCMSKGSCDRVSEECGGLCAKIWYYLDVVEEREP